MEELLSVEHLNAYYKKKQILRDISFHIAPGEIVGLVGESGSGKSTLARAILNLGPTVSGTIVQNGKAQMIFQDPYHSLNPAKTIGSILTEPLVINGGYSREERREKAEAMMEHVGLEASLFDHYPGELSGGQRQRVCIGTALMQNPSLIFADEPVSALDVTVQAKVLQLLNGLNKEDKIAFLFISHDLRVVYELCSRILIMKDGRLIEQGTDDEIFFHPKEEYTKKLLSAIM